MSAIAHNWCFFTIFKQPFWSPSAYQATLMPGASDLAILMWSQWIKSHWPNKSSLIGPTLAQFLYAIWVYQTCMCCCINSVALLMLKWRVNPFSESSPSPGHVRVRVRVFLSAEIIYTFLWFNIQKANTKCFHRRVFTWMFPVEGAPFFF